MTCTVPGRLLSLVLVIVLCVTLATPAPAAAMEPTTIITLASLGVGVLAVIGYLIVANMEGDKPRTEVPRAALPQGEPREEASLWLVCPSGKCPPVVLPTTASPEPPPTAAAPDVASGAGAVSAGTVMERQGP